LNQINVAMDNFYDNLKMGLDPAVYMTPVVAEYMEVMLNVEDPVPSVLLDHLVYHAFDAREISQVRTSFERFHGSIFGFKMRPWTKVLLIKKSIDFDSVNEIVAWVCAANETGCFLDDVSVVYLLANVSLKEQVKLAVAAGQRDFITNHHLADHLVQLIVEHIDVAKELYDDKTILLAIQSLAHRNGRVLDLALCGLKSLDLSGKDDRTLFNPHFGNGVETVEDIGALYVEIAALLCDLTHDINTLDFSSTIKEWKSQANQLHQEWGDLVDQRSQFKLEFLFEEEKREAGIQYTMDNMGVYSIRGKLEKMRSKNVHRPVFIDNDYAMLSTSDFELEQKIYECEHGDEWERIRGFVQQRVDEIRAVAKEAHEKTKSEMTNSRWEDHQDVFDEYKRPNSKPKLPLE